MAGRLDDRLRTLLTMGLLLVLVVAGAAWGWSAATKPFPGRVEAPTCLETTITAGTRVFPDQVTVSVLNAGDREGLAGRTLGLFEDEGFGRGQTGNAPEDTEVAGAQVWTETPGSPAARLVASRLGKDVEVVRRDTTTAGVTVVVGDGFRKLVKGRKAVKARNDVTICSPPS
ncbi:LytR C-terminal domain-containing protein [Nocardioides sp. SYSU DS0663]|uniref:LytR C-terminal domain-containing protein n=1 Tax=Nocardioides sp. SYSU DS0663 TaxID=3416445 RepID=UPI003F4C16AC